MTTGANKDDHHLRGVDIERDIKPDAWADLRTVQKGEACPNCETGTLDIFKAMEIGHIFKLGTKYSESMGATVLTQEGKEVPIVMGSYGIGVERIMSAAVEQSHDADGIVWPRAIAPFDVIVTVTNVKQQEITDAGEQLYADLARAPASKSSSTTATSARASSSRTPTSSASPSASPSARRSPKARSNSSTARRNSPRT